MNRPVLIGSTLAVLVLSFGCAKKPATSVTSVAPPSGPSSSSGMESATAGSSGERSQTAKPVAPPAAATTTAGRPAPREFVAVSDLQDIHFDFDKYVIRPPDAQALDGNARWLKANARDLLLIEGHCDERGTDEYNLALGERRAKAAMNYLVSQGVAENRITIISYGKERPLCNEHNEACWAKNRRAHFLVKHG